MKKTPKSLRLQIGLFGRTNVGKSTFLNYVTNQEVAITSPIPGTTTDVVEKAMELLPVGPVLFLDTAGLDDISPLALPRMKKTRKIFRRADIFILVTEAGQWDVYEKGIATAARDNGSPLIVAINKSDIQHPEQAFIKKIKEITPHVIIASAVDSEKRNRTIIDFKQAILNTCPEDFLNPPPLLGDLVPEKGLLLMVVPIDLEAPRGRLILPQVQALRDALDHNLIGIIVKEDKIKDSLGKLSEPPDLTVCDSQVVQTMVRDLPGNSACTTFSILFARNRGNLEESVKGVMKIRELKDGDRILIAESCSHHPIEGDIGKVKIPGWLRKYTGADICFDTCQGRDYPEDLQKYELIIHCGACMVTRREMLGRVQQAIEQNVPITNYGVCIAFLQGVLERVLSPFQAALEIYRNNNAEK